MKIELVNRPNINAIDGVARWRAALFNRVLTIVENIDMLHWDHAGVEVGNDETGVYLQVIVERPDAYTGDVGWGRGGKVYIHPEQTDSSVARTVLARFMAYFEHEVREAFLYKGKRVYGPHIDVEALCEVADRLES